jgi:isocitrate dehydrogenase (NAD+)
LIRSAVLMMQYLGEDAVAARIETAISRVVSEKGQLTRDLGGSCTTTELTEALVAEIAAA